MRSLIQQLSFFAVFVLPVVMPEELPANYLSQQGFLPFQETSNVSPPYFASLSFNGMPIGSPGTPQVSELFFDTAFAFLPEGVQIQKLSDASGREVWNYPVGTEVAHDIHFNDVGRSLFELRVLRKISITEWDFASYAPSSPGDPHSPLIRNHYTGVAPFSTTLQLSNGSNPRIDLKRINLGFCKNCHMATSPAAYQYPSLNEAGPCGFGPKNELGIQTWIQNYEAKFGHSPFSN